MLAAISVTSCRRPRVEETPGGDNTPAAPVAADDNVVMWPDPGERFLQRSHDNYAAVPTTVFRQSHDERPWAIKRFSVPRDDDGDGNPKQF